MKKAFDNVNRTCLLDKLRNIGINGNMYFAVKTIYENVSCTVRVNGILYCIYYTNMLFITKYSFLKSIFLVTQTLGTYQSV